MVTSGDLVNPAPDAGLAERRLALKLFYGVGSVILPKWRDDQLSRPANDADPESVMARLQAVRAGLAPKDIPTAERLVAAAKAIPETSDLKPSLDLEFLLHLSGDDPGGVCRFAGAARRLGPGRARSGVAAAARLPNASSPHECRAYVFMTQERWDEAEAEARHNIEAVPNGANGYEDLANVEGKRAGGSRTRCGTSPRSPRGTKTAIRSRWG